MAVTDYNKLKKISPTNTNNAGATVDKAQPVLLEMGRRDGSISSPESTNTTTSTSFDVVVKEGYQAIPNYFVGIENANDSNSLDYNLEVRDSSDNILVSQTGTIAAGDDLGVSEGTFSKEDYSRIPSNETITIVFESTNGVSFYYNSSIPGEDELFFSVASGQSVPTRSGGSGFGIGIDSVNDDTVTGTGSVGLDWTNISSESDIAVYDQNDNLLPYEIESFDSTSETATLWCYNSWVRDDTVQAQIVYGGSPTGREDNTTGTWPTASGPNYEIVHHFQNENPALDSTSNNWDEAAGTITNRNAAGQIDGGFEYDGVDDYIHVDFTDGLFAVNNISFSFWFKTTATNRAVIQYAHANGDYGERITAEVNQISTDVLDVNLAGANDSSNPKLSGTTTVNDGAWHHGVLTFDSGALTLYVDGSQEDTATYDGATAPASDIMPIGRYDRVSTAGGPDGTGGYFPGTIDEHKTMMSTMSAAEVQAEYDASPKAGQVFFSQSAARTTTTTKITANETINSQDVYARNLNVFRSYSENVSANDLLKLVPVLKFSESVSSSDTISKTISLQNNEDVSISATYNDNYGTLSGTVTLDSSPVQGAKVYAVRDSDLQQVGSDTTDSNGNYNINSIEENQVILVAVDYDDAGTLYGEEKSIDF